MRILKIDDRYFLAQNERDVHDIALKVLNEHRNFGAGEEDTQAFIEQVCDEMDGDTALMIIAKWHDVRSIVPEVI